MRGNPAGPKRGATTTRVRLMREFAEMIVTHPEVQAKLFEQALAGRLNPRLMLELFHYHGGKPPERVVDPTPDTRRARHVDVVRRLSKEDRALLAELSTKMIAIQESL